MMEFCDVGKLSEVLTKKCRPIVNRNNDFTIVCSHKLGFIETDGTLCFYD